MNTITTTGGTFDKIYTTDDTFGTTPSYIYINQPPIQHIQQPASYPCSLEVCACCKKELVVNGYIGKTGIVIANNLMHALDIKIYLCEDCRQDLVDKIKTELGME